MTQCEKGDWERMRERKSERVISDSQTDRERGGERERERAWWLVLYLRHFQIGF